MSIRLVVIVIALFFFVSSFGQTTDTTTFDIVEQMPSFPGGNPLLIKYLLKHLKPTDDDINYFTNKVAVQFIIEKDGKLTHFTILRPDDMPPKLRRKVKKIFMSGPRWVPGKQNGRNVRVRINLPMWLNLESFVAPALPDYHL